MFLRCIIYPCKYLLFKKNDNVDFQNMNLKYKMLKYYTTFQLSSRFNRKLLNINICVIMNNIKNRIKDKQFSPRVNAI